LPLLQKSALQFWYWGLRSGADGGGWQIEFGQARATLLIERAELSRRLLNDAPPDPDVRTDRRAMDLSSFLRTV
jgi:hypothetical protein